MTIVVSGLVIVSCIGAGGYLVCKGLMKVSSRAYRNRFEYKDLG